MEITPKDRTLIYPQIDTGDHWINSENSIIDNQSKMKCVSGGLLCQFLDELISEKEIYVEMFTFRVPVYTLSLPNVSRD